MPSYALISVSDKTGLAPFARGLADLGYHLLSTGGTAKSLEADGLAVTQVSEVTGFPEMLDGRVKTLHPRVHGGILARRDKPDHLASLAEHGIPLIDLVVVNLYPFAKAAANPETTVPGLIEQIDIGGPGMVRAAAKNFRDVLVLVDPADYPTVLEALAGGAAAVPQALRFDLARKAFAHTGAYDQMIAAELAQVTMSEDGGTRIPADAREVFPEVVTRTHTRIRTLRYGENPHQPAAWYADEPTGFGNVTIHQGKELSFTNLLDLDAAARIVLEFSEPAASVIKHTNPCGVATGSDAADAYVRARDADPVSAFGGIIGLNRPLDVATAEAIVSTFIEAVVAPEVEDAARAILARKANLRVVTADFAALAAAASLEWRSILGASLVQQRDRVPEAGEPWGAASALTVVTQRQPTAEEWQALRFAWRVCAHVKSNTILFASADRTLGVGAGQMSRVDSVKVAIMKAGEGALKGSVVASDAFFPFRDGLDAIAAAGATAIVQPGGSMRDQEVIDAANEHGLAMVFTGRRHFRH
ncbi:bifunctional phosphoribosylaminoimidazolecarboxamide formyltransferase/IMP cyclohydrolase [Luteitalea sp.]|uniref:bifunctional phosphoribosylaminoimidazolecarboxamide formyltransferase/IMP cyclohydrolase n=1 Tax=Luteitalea sp. TaxID=2004800 RepID=UPI0025B7F8BD|nr:bifunctional phosphoribosylaminoimidazolecarboxamide formyltransferase/IMP cyclohydrolase [Luteitalea sp.]